MSEPPSPDGRKSRSEAASRLAALLADVSEETTPASPAPVLPGEVLPGADEPEAPTVTPDLSSFDRLLSEPPDLAGPSADDGSSGLRLDAPDADPLDPLDGPAFPGELAEEPGPAEDLSDFVLPGVEEPDLVLAPPGDDDLVAAGVEEPELVLAPPRDDALVMLQAEEPESVADPLDDGAGAPGADQPELVAVSIAGGDDDGGRGAPPVEAPPAPAPEVGDTGHQRRLTLRSVAFGAAFALLVAAVPVLGVVGARRLGDSRGGQLVQGNRDRSEPGYRALVDPTRTALVVHRDDAGNLSSATLLALGAGPTGGTVLQLPLTTQVRDSKFLIGWIGQAYELGTLELFYREVEDRLGVAVQELIDLTDGQLAELVRSVAPLTVDNPDDIALDDGRIFEAGEATLAAEDVGPFLRATSDGESELARLARNETVWMAWLEALGAAGDDAVGSATAATGLGPFLQVLAAGASGDDLTTRVETLDVSLPVDAAEDNPTLIPAEGFDGQITAAVPYPQSPGPGRRYALKLLNGVEGAPLPRALMRDLIGGGAALAQLGNGESFGQATTTIEIADVSWRPAADAAQLILGGTPTITTMEASRAESEGADMVITVGRDVLGRYEGDDGG